jgi:hypothetical protein
MSPDDPITLARRAAALSRHHGAEHERTLEAVSQWRVARLLEQIGALADEERAVLLELAAAR